MCMCVCVSLIYHTIENGAVNAGLSIACIHCFPLDYSRWVPTARSRPLAGTFHNSRVTAHVVDGISDAGSSGKQLREASAIQACSSKHAPGGRDRQSGLAL